MTRFVAIDKTIYHAKPHSICFLPQYQRQSRKVFFFRAWAEKGFARDIDASRVVWTLIDNGKLANQIARLAEIVVKTLIYTKLKLKTCQDPALDTKDLEKRTLHLDFLNLNFKKIVMSCNVSYTRDSVSSGCPNTKYRVENTTCSGLFLTKFKVFPSDSLRNTVSGLWSVYLLNRKKN